MKKIFLTLFFAFFAMGLMAQENLNFCAFLAETVSQKNINSSEWSLPVYKKAIVMFKYNEYIVSLLTEDGSCDFKIKRIERSPEERALSYSDDNFVVKFGTYYVEDNKGGAWVIKLTPDVRQNRPDRKMAARCYLIIPDVAAVCYEGYMS